MILLTGLRLAFTPVTPSLSLQNSVSSLQTIIADVSQCHRVSSALEAGTVGHNSDCISFALTYLIQVWVNQYNVLYNNVPFGGKKQSGIGTRGCSITRDAN
jgi:hypothetical protein